MLKSKGVDVTGGPLYKSILKYAIPIMLASFVQGIFNAADLAVIGNMADEISVASVGATSTVVSLLVNSFVGLSVGVNALLARCIGKKDDARTSKVVNTAMLFSIALGVFVMLLCFIIAEPVLRLMDCPEDCFDGAVLYMRIYAFGLPALMIYNFGASIIRTTGDSQKPFTYIVLAGILNVVLNFILCLILSQKVAAVAIATVASQYLSCLLVLVYLHRLEGPCSFKFNRSLSFSGGELLRILKIGAPCAFQSSLFSLSNLQMGTALNSYGTEAIAGNSAACTMENAVSSFCTGFNAAIVPFVGQNLGSGNKQRVKKSILYCVITSIAIGLILSWGVFLFRYEILGVYLPSSEVAVEFGVERMKCVLLLYPFAAVFSACTNAMQAFGYSFIPMMNSILTILVFRLAWMQFIYPPLNEANRNILNLYICYSFSWTLNMIAQLTMFIIVYSRYKRGKLKEL